MGNNISSVPEEIASRPENMPVFQSRSISEEQDIPATRPQLEEMKFAIIGTGGCGKTTFIKQICLITGSTNYGHDEDNINDCIIDCILTAALQIYRYATKVANPPIEFVDKESALAVHRLAEQHIAEKHPLYESMFKFFHDPEVIRIMDEQRATLHIADGTYHLLKNVSKYNEFGIVQIKAKDRRTMRGMSVISDSGVELDGEIQVMKCVYKPNDEDYIFASRKTTGIVEIKFPIEDKMLVLNDGGGQRNERKKWVNPLNYARAIVFFASLSDYYQVAYEDDSTNRLVEQLNAFSKYVGRFINQVDCILIFNKAKLMQESLPKYNISEYFPEFTGDSTDFVQVRDFIVNLFLNLVNEDYRDRVFIRFVEATETTSVENLLREPLWKGEGLRDNLLLLNNNT